MQKGAAVPRRYRKSATAYGEILDVAAKVFDERGYHESSVQDIADAAGLTKGGLYHHLSSKEATLFAINERYLRAGLAEVKAIAVREDVPVADRLRELVIAIASQHDTYYPDLRVTLREFDVLHDDFRNQLIGLRDEYEGVIRTVLETGIREGAIVDEDPEVLLMFLFGALNWMCMWYRQDGSLKAADWGQHFSDLIARAVLVPAPTKRARR
jgi:TetR/AcrR family transcriptional regulator, cholesterol catabolism regulator